MVCNPCCCFSLKDGAMTIGIWTVVFAVAQLGIMGWQMAAIKYEKDRAANTLLPNYNTYGRYDIPSYYESYWQSPEERYYTGLFVIQILCLISAFFLLFASCAMLYGIHTWSRYLVWPWFPCMVSSILCSLAYCIMWWAGDVRDYWLALTILEIIGVFINVYCTVVVMMYYRRITRTTDEYEGKDRRVRYKVNRNHSSSRRDLLDNDGFRRPRSPEQFAKSPYPNYNPMQQGLTYPSPYSPAGIPQTPLPLPPNYTPYPTDPNEVRMSYRREPKGPPPLEDPVAHWVRGQQSIERAEANSEPVSPSKDVHATFPMQHSRSVPSLFDGTNLVSHKDCRHKRGDHRRSSSRRHRSKSRNHYDDSVGPSNYSSDSETRTDFGRRRDGSRRRSRSRPRYEESEVTTTTDHRHKDRDRKHERHRDDRHDREGGRRRKEDDSRSSRRRRHDRDREREHGREREDERDDDDRGSRRRHRRHRDERDKEPSVDNPAVDPNNPLAGGIFIPHQHIVIPPSTGERGPDGQPMPQKVQINSEITINYDQNGTPLNSSGLSDEPYRRRLPPMQITSNV